MNQKNEKENSQSVKIKVTSVISEGRLDTEKGIKN